jgi:hypothetical protein
VASPLFRWGILISPKEMQAACQLAMPGADLTGTRVFLLSAEEKCFHTRKVANEKRTEARQSAHSWCEFFIHRRNKPV